MSTGFRSFFGINMPDSGFSSSSSSSRSLFVSGVESNDFEQNVKNMEILDPDLLRYPDTDEQHKRNYNNLDDAREQLFLLELGQMIRMISANKKQIISEVRKYIGCGENLPEWRRLWRKFVDDLENDPDLHVACHHQGLIIAVAYLREFPKYKVPKQKNNNQVSEKKAKADEKELSKKKENSQEIIEGLWEALKKPKKEMSERFLEIPRLVYFIVFFQME